MRTLLFVTLLCALSACTVQSVLEDFATAVANLQDAGGRSLTMPHVVIDGASNKSINSANSAIEGLRKIYSNASTTTKRKNYVVYDAPTQMAMKEQSSQLGNINAKLSSMVAAKQAVAQRYARINQLNANSLESQENSNYERMKAIEKSQVDASINASNEAANNYANTVKELQARNKLYEQARTTKAQASTFIPSAYTSDEMDIFKALTDRLAKNN